MKVHKVYIEYKNPICADYFKDKYVYIGTTKNQAIKQARALWKAEETNNHLKIINIEVHSENIDRDGFWYYKDNYEYNN